ncbi:glycosyltransferase [Halorussus pelagicus]|uniref:glycosyltransferase n=1 Tax=Halorussus pelagicus TaxID=2505977 RepID=UPI000FFC11C8|nr:glycosyltransferase [Halorussus pelagicus]
MAGTPSRGRTPGGTSNSRAEGDAEAGELRVCHVVPALGDGGVQNLLLNMVEHAESNVKHAVSYVKELETSLEPAFEAKGVPTAKVGRARTFDPRAAATLARYVRANDVDVLHAHLPWQQVVARLAGLATDAAVVSTHHNLGDNSHPAVLAAERATRLLDAATVAVSEAVAERYAGRWPPGGDRWRVVHNGIDVREFREAVRSRDPDEKTSKTTYLHVGRYIPGKAQRDLLGAMASVVERHPDSHLYLVGWGDLEETLRETADRLGIAANVSVTGYQSDVEDYYARADAFVSSSLSEGFPITYIESMAAELPIVSTAFGGAADIVADGETGFVVPTRDRAALAEAMTTLQDAETRHQMGRAGYERAEELFDVARTEAAYGEIYRESVGGATGGFTATSRD